MLTSREQDALAFITQYFADNGSAPLLSEIGSALNLKAKSHLHRLLKALQEKGYIERSRQHRGIRLIGQPGQAEREGLPYVGRIAAGLPIEAIENIETINVNELFEGRNRYVLKVQGESMCDAGIMDGDWVVIAHGSHARNGQIVVALIDRQEATLKRIEFVDDDTIALIPENREMAKQTYPRERVTVQGVLVGQFRNYGA